MKIRLRPIIVGLVCLKSVIGAAEKKLQIDVDSTREKTFLTLASSEINPNKLQKKMDGILENHRGFTECPDGKPEDLLKIQILKKLPSSEEKNYRDYFLVKTQTIYKLPSSSFYSLPYPFKGAYLFSPKQALNALRKVGIVEEFLTTIDAQEFWTFSVMLVQLLPPQLSEKALNAHKGDILKAYETLCATCIAEFDDRLQDDYFVLNGFADSKMTQNLMKYSQTPSPREKNIQDLFAVSLSSGNKENKKEMIIRGLAEKWGYNAESICGLLEKLDPKISVTLDPVTAFTALCKGLEDGHNIRSTNTRRYISIPTRVAQKLQRDENASIIPEFLEGQSRILARKYALHLHEEMKDNFAAALKQRS